MGARGWEREGWSTENFRAVKLLCMILQWRIHVIMYLFKPIECTRSRMNHDVNDALQMIKFCRVGSSFVANVPLWWEMLI